MKTDSTPSKSRRELIKLVGSTAVLAPLVGITACSGGDEPSSRPAAPSESPPRDTGGSRPADAGAGAEEAASAAENAAAATSPSPASGGMPKLSEDDPQAKSLAYVHDASDIDGAAQPRFKAGQACSNCALYQAKDGEEWGACSIFPGRLVKGTGWCTVYAPKAG